MEDWNDLKENVAGESRWAWGVGKRSNCLLHWKGGHGNPPNSYVFLKFPACLVVI